jgi:hypothetical protein
VSCKLPEALEKPTPARVVGEVACAAYAEAPRLLAEVVELVEDESGVWVDASCTKHLMVAVVASLNY